MIKPKKPQAHGHRGARGLFPENSLPAIAHAISLGCDAVEVDLCVTADHHLILNHNPILFPDLVRDHTDNWVSPGLYVYEMTLEQIKQLNIGKIRPGSDYQQRFARQKRMKKVAIPTIEEYVALVKESHATITYNLELKNIADNPRAFPSIDQYIELVCEKLKRLDILENTFIQSFDWRLPLALKKIFPALEVGLLTDQQPNNPPTSPNLTHPTSWIRYRKDTNYQSHPHLIKSLGADIWSSNALDLNQEQVNLAHRLGLKVYAWTVNEVEDIKNMIEFGVDAITSDYPDRLLELLKTNDL